MYFVIHILTVNIFLTVQLCIKCILIKKCINSLKTLLEFFI